MKNTIVIDATKNCICDLVSTVDNGENRVFIEVHVDISLNPRLEIESEQVTITENPFIYEIKNDYYIGTGNLQFRIVDNNLTGDYFQIAKIENIEGTLFLSQVSNFVYTLRCPVQSDAPLGGCDCGDLKNRVEKLETKTGELDTRLGTAEKEIDELKKSVSDGKKQLADAITSKGVPTASDETFPAMANNVRKIESGGNNSGIFIDCKNALSLQVLPITFGDCKNTSQSLSITFISCKNAGTTVTIEEYTE